MTARYVITAKVQSSPLLLLYLIFPHISLYISLSLKVLVSSIPPLFTLPPFVQSTSHLSYTDLPHISLSSRLCPVFCFEHNPTQNNPVDVKSVGQSKQ